MLVLHGSLWGLFAEAWHCLPGPVDDVTGSTAGRARQVLLLPRSFDAAAFLPGAEQLMDH